MKAGTYNGHKSWAYWNVSLWLFNDEGLYRMMQGEAARAKNKDKAARAIVQNLADMKLRQTPDGARYSISAVRAAIAGDSL